MNAPITRVKDVMQKEVLSIDGMASAVEVAAMMRASRVSELLVDKRHDDDAWGIITIMDLVNSIILPGRDAEKVFAYEIMTKPVLTIPAQMDIRYAIRLIQRIGIHRAPVEYMGEIVGMVTLSGLILDNNLLWPSETER
jgi:signal-transduction protein with cAMP-binding, CBS, and nucleotidyltransferase domain